MTAPWYASRYTGLFTHFGALSPRPHDPQLALCSATAPEAHGSGIGWDDAAAEGACVGEGIERFQSFPVPQDQFITASTDEWPLDEPIVPMHRWVLFHPEQYAQIGFPFAPPTGQTECPWVACRQAVTGEPMWAPAERVFLNTGTAHGHALAPGLSTGLACGRAGDPILLRGLQEVLERDAVVAAWWGRYPLEEHAISKVLAGLRPDAADRLLRPNLTYRCFRVASPFAAHVAVVTLEGDDREGWCFSAGSACRETAAAAWEKALLEAVHGRHYVRHLLQQIAAKRMTLGACPTSFAEHAVWYSARPRDLEGTLLCRPLPRGTETFPPSHDTVGRIIERLGPERPVLFRNLTPPALAGEGLGWHVLRVLVPGLQPLHGDHRLAQLGGPLWAPRGLAEWATMPPHPFP